MRPKTLALAPGLGRNFSRNFLQKKMKLKTKPLEIQVHLQEARLSLTLFQTDGARYRQILE